LLAETGLPARRLKKSLDELKKHLMIVEWQKDGKIGFSQAD